MRSPKWLLLGASATAISGCHLVTDVDDLEIGAPPKNTALPTISGLSQIEQELAAEPGSWDGSAPIRYEYQWQRCNAAGKQCTDIAGATEPIYLLRLADEDARIRVRVTAFNVAGDASVSSALTQAVVPPIVGKVGTAGPALTVRSGPGTNFSSVGSVPNGATVTIHCQVKGETVTGTYGTSNLWDDIGIGFIADVYVFTGSDFQVAPLCP